MKQGNVLSDINQTLVNQLRSTNPFFVSEYSITCVIQLKENSLRLHSRNRGKVINIDITYNTTWDLYDIKAYLIRGTDCKPLPSFEGVYFDQLHDIIKEILFKKQECE